MRGFPSLRARLSGLHRLDISDSHLAQIHRSHGQTLLVIGFLSGFDVELLQEEGDELQIGKRCVPLVLILYPSVQLQGDQLARIDRLLGEESCKPRVV